MKIKNPLKFNNQLDLPKLLVLVSSLPGTKHGGGVVLDEILQRYPKDRYVCFCLEPPEWANGQGEVPASLRGVPWRCGPLLPRLHFRGGRFYQPLLRFLGFRGLAAWRVRQAVAFGKRHGVELVWAEFQGDALIIAQRVAAGLGVPFVGTVWDDPEGWLADGGYDRLSRNLLRRRFQEALAGARCLSTTGEAMQSAYEREYGVKSVILRHGFEHAASPPMTPRQANGIIIGFVGSAYGRDAWTAFLAAAARLNASGQVPPIRVRAFGPGVPYRHPGVEVEDRGWQPAEVMLREIAATDFCYLPYWFEAHKRRHVELSFPSKFETYLAASRPVLFHGPAYAGIAQAVSRYGVGVCIHGLDQGEIAAALKRLIQDPDLRESYSRASLAAFHAEFNAGQMLKNFAELIGVAPALLQLKAPGELMDNQG